MAQELKHKHHETNEDDFRLNAEQMVFMIT